MQLSPILRGWGAGGKCSGYLSKSHRSHFLVYDFRTLRPPFKAVFCFEKGEKMKKIFILSLSATLFLSFCAMAACDENSNCVFDCSPEGSEGSCTATLQGSTLTISGTGAIKSYNFSYEGANGLPTSNPAPWYQEVVARSNVQKVVIEEGITSVGSHAFEDMYSLKEVVLPQSVTSIGTEAFTNIPLKKINLPEGLTSLPNFAVSQDVSELIIPSTVTSIGAYTLPYNTEELIIPENVTSLSARAFSDSNIANYGLKKLYCPENLASQCAAALSYLAESDQSIELISYQKTSDGKIFYNNKWYNNANGILSGDYNKKRIYTIEEATKISKKSGNTFKIRYK